MPKPFPYPLNVGTDICSISRILTLLSRHDGRKSLKFMSRILNKYERTQLSHKLRTPLATYLRAVRSNAIAEWRSSHLTVRERSTAARQLRDRFFDHKPPKDWSTAVFAAFRDLGPSEGLQQQEVALRAEVEALRDWKLEKKFALVPSPWETLLEDLQKGKPIHEAFDEARNVVKARVDAYASEQPENSGKQLEEDMQTWIQEGILLQQNHAEGGEGDEGLALQGQDSSESKELQQLTLKTRGELEAAQAQLKQAAQLLAGRFAAKEAVIKAHPSVKLTYHDIIIHQPPWTDSGSKAPVAIVIPKDRNMAEAQEAKISISHDEGFATAVCLAVGPEPASENILLPAYAVEPSPTKTKSKSVRPRISDGKKKQR